jgi:gliding motility-associated-like protein
MRYWFFTFCSLIFINTVLAAKKDIEIVGQRSLSTPAGQPITISLTDLTVAEGDDGDGSYPTGYILEVFEGDNYTISGQTVTPSPGFAGMLIVPVRISKNDDRSKKYDLQVQVLAEENVPPAITGQAALSTPENTAITLEFSHLTVSDPDNTYPTGFTMTVAAGTNYTVSGTTVTPAAGFAGDLTVPVTVNDGTSDSNPFNVVITVEPHVNVAPTITGQATISTPENTAVTLQFSHLTVSDPDNTYPTGFTMTVAAGTNYTVSGTTVTPSTGFAGNLSVPVTVNDGTNDSSPFNVVITVEAHVNVAPVITGQAALSTPANTAITIQLSHLTVSDPDNAYPTGFTLTVSAGTNYTVNGATVTPVAGFSGNLSVPVVVNDGASNSAPFNLVITVNPPANVAPRITGQVALSTPANTPITVQLSHLSVSDPDNTYPTGFTLMVSAGNNYSVSGTTVTPAAGFSGTLNVPVTVNDGVNNSEPFNLVISVTPHVNVSPVITGQVPISIVQNTPLLITLSHLTVTDPDNVYPDDFRLSVIGGTNYSVAGDIITPALNFTGVLSVRVSVNDGANDSAPFNLNVTVTPSTVNQPPVITGQAGLNTFKNTAVRIGLGHLTVSDPDDTYPQGFVLKVLPGDNYTAAGDLVTPAANFIGTLSVNVVVNDGTSDSAPFAFKINVTDRGELQITGQVPLTVREDSSLTIQLTNLSVNDSRNTYPAGFTLSVLPGEHYTANSTTVIPAADFDGNLTVGVTVSNGTETSSPFNLLIVVTPINDPPEVTLLETDPLLYAAGSNPRAISETLVVADVDDEYLLLADIRFQSESYQSGLDELTFENTQNIRGVFDAQEGILSLIGHAPLSEYTAALRSIRYHFNNPDTVRSTSSKVLYLTLNDGKNVSNTYERQISFAEDSGLDIPNAFTPNNDQANDTWKITPLKDGNWFNTAVVRVYNNRGVLVYQATGFDHEWDGRLNGDVLPPEIYFYTIEVPDAKTRYRGVVSILR